VFKALSSVQSNKRSAPSRPLRILVADDNLDSVATLQVLLQGEGHRVRAVRRSVDVLGVESEFKPDVVILDLQMPDISGYDLARWLRSRHPRRCPLLIAVTGAYTRPSDRDLSLHSGFDHYVTKPYRLEELLALMPA
jgi:DNA-binding response OmpR family regulator